jgi:hypothetical protein
MIRRALLVAAGLLAAACFACVPKPVPAPSPMAGPGPQGCAVNAIRMLNTAKYDNKDDSNFAPEASELTPAPSYIVNYIWAAYKLSPKFFQDELCKLDGIYIAPGGDSWGVRNWQTSPLKRYVVLSADLWPNRGSPSDLPTYEGTVLYRLTGLGSDAERPNYPSHPNDDAYGPAITILGVLAHEYGHVLFYDTFVDPPGTTPKFSTPENFCPDFFTDSWEDLPTSAIMWRYYADVAGTHKSGDVDVNDLAPTSGSTATKKETLLDQFFRRPAARSGGTGRWASLWAAFSPDHDFAETFRLFVLLNSQRPLRSLPIEIRTAHVVRTHDVIANCKSRPVLMHKLECFRDRFCSADSAVCSSVCASPATKP